MACPLTMTILGTHAESDVVVMTTEILRNIMYRGQAEADAQDRLASVGLVVLDEVGHTFSSCFNNSSARFSLPPATFSHVCGGMQHEQTVLLQSLLEVRC